MAGKSVLIVEDDEDILELVRYNLAKEGYEVAGVRSGEEAIQSVDSVKPDLIVLDLMLPGLDGLEVCKHLKNDESARHVSIVMLTAKGEEADIVTGLEMGADDYITKPFSPRVLSARVRAVLRRKAKDPSDDRSVVRIGDLIIHPGRNEVLLNDESIDLTFTEFRILHFLARRPGWVFTRDQIVDAARGEGYPVTARSVDVHIVGLRKKLGPAREFIETVRGIGYRFKE